MMLTSVFLVIALVLFVLAAIGVPATKYNLIAFGLAAWVAAQLFGPLLLLK